MARLKTGIPVRRYRLLIKLAPDMVVGQNELMHTQNQDFTGRRYGKICKELLIFHIRHVKCKARWH